MFELLKVVIKKLWAIGMKEKLKKVSFCIPSLNENIIYFYRVYSGKR